MIFKMCRTIARISPANLDVMETFLLGSERHDEPFDAGHELMVHQSYRGIQWEYWCAHD